MGLAVVHSKGGGSAFVHSLFIVAPIVCHLVLPRVAIILSNPWPHSFDFLRLNTP